MDGRSQQVSGSVQRRLSAALALAIGAMALVAGAFSFVAAYDEARELQDDALRRVAQLIEHQSAHGQPLPHNLQVQGEEDDSRIIIQRLDAASTEARTGPSDARLPLSASLPDGPRTVDLGGEPFRVLVRTTARGERFAVAQDSRLRRELARYAALRTLLPFMLLVPVLLLLVARLVHQLFRPIRRLATEVDERSEEDLRPIADIDLPTEVRPFVRAINRLLGRVGETLAAQRRFVADAAHELRSPLTALSLQAEHLAATDLPASARERLAALRQGIERGRGLVEQLLALARAQTSAPAAPTQPLSLQAIFRRVLEDLLPLAESRAIDVGVEGEQDAAIDAPRELLYTLARNLVDNAIRYTPEGGRVDLSVVVEADRATLRVSDTGPGIPPGERGRVLEPFYRVPGHDVVGSGLGLAIVQSIADRLGAELTLGYADPMRQAGLEVSVRFAPARAERTTD
ncbi:MAG: two-component sensor histidine kinase [Burkholderiales bacterium 66-5]|nr:MAG: two-component sensor histidine kinase [Burkholderiales bacterium 66-5]